MCIIDKSSFFKEYITYSKQLKHSFQTKFITNHILMKQTIAREDEPFTTRINKADQGVDCSTTAKNLESALEDFMKLSIDCDKSQLDKHTSRREERSFRIYSTQRIRFRPYEIPANILNANLQFKQEKLHLAKMCSPTTSSSSPSQRNLMGIKLEGCEFHGKSKISTFNSLARPKPCWLQHQQRCGGGYRIAGKWTTLEEDRQELNAKLDEDDSDQQKNGQDLGLNELSDYFQHFVSICAPKMSDLAQSMYA